MKKIYLVLPVIALVFFAGVNLTKAQTVAPINDNLTRFVGSPANPAEGVVVYYIVAMRTAFTTTPNLNISRGQINPIVTNILNLYHKFGFTNTLLTGNTFGPQAAAATMRLRSAFRLTPGENFDSSAFSAVERFTEQFTSAVAKLPPMTTGFYIKYPGSDDSAFDVTTGRFSPPTRGPTANVSASDPNYAICDLAAWCGVNPNLCPDADRRAFDDACMGRASAGNGAAKSGTGTTPPLTKCQDDINSGKLVISTPTATNITSSPASLSAFLSGTVKVLTSIPAGTSYSAQLVYGAISSFPAISTTLASGSIPTPGPNPLTLSGTAGLSPNPALAPSTQYGARIQVTKTSPGSVGTLPNISRCFGLTKDFKSLK